jgi:cystathionine gamma-synthase
MSGRHIETDAVHLARPVDPATGGVTPALVRATTFLHDGAANGLAGWQYTRYDNPNRQQIEATITALEGGHAALAFASGNAASYALLQTAPPGSRVVASRDNYHGTQVILDTYAARMGLTVDYVDATDLDAVRAVVTDDTSLVYIETPTNPLLRIVDIAAVAEICHARSARLAVDNTFATPVLQRPLSLGADLVVHSATKFLGGHSDLLAGLVVVREDGETLDAVRHWQQFGGAVPAPDVCWLLGRSLATLPIRIRAQADTARRVAEALVDHPEVHVVLYPDLPDHPGHDIAARQMEAGGAVLSIRVRGGQEQAIAVTQATELCRCATSLGGVETLLEQRRSQDGADSNTPPDLIRISIGLEHADDLIADLDQALSR